MLKILFIFLILPVSVLASGEYNSGPLSLIAPFFNFFVFVGGLLYLIKKGVATYFNSYSDSIKNQVLESDDRCREATLRLENYENKLSDFEQVTKKVINEVKQDIVKFEHKYIEEIEESKERMKKEYEMRIQNDSQSMIRAVDESFIDTIINEAKKSVAADPTLSANITDKIISSIH